MRIMESATILKPPRTTFLYVQKQSFKDRADKIIAMKEKEISHTVSHFSYAPLFQSPHFLTKMLESNILYDYLLIDILSV